MEQSILYPMPNIVMKMIINIEDDVKRASQQTGLFTINYVIAKLKQIKPLQD